MTLPTAALAPAIAGLLPVGVVAAQLRGSASEEALLPAERAVIAHCAPKRIGEFAAGRACARRALQELGMGEFALLPGKDRQPLWPPGIIGSITHTEGYAAAVVARQGAIGALGVDAEVVEAVSQTTWHGICAPDELGRLLALPSERARRAGALLFAAKEAFYKCQFPLTGEWLGFADVIIESADWGGCAGAFRVVPRRALRLLARSGAGALAGRFLFCRPWVIAAMALPATATGPMALGDAPSEPRL